MAEKFGGPYSPDDRDAGKGWLGKRRSRVGARVNFLFLVPLPLAVRAFTQDPGALAMTLVALGVLLLSAWLTREGLLAQEAYEGRKIARRPALPRKLLGSALMGIGLYTAVYAAGGGVINGAIFATLGGVLHSFAFGLDPMRNKGMAGIDSFQQDRVARVVEEGEKHLKSMKDAILRAGDRKLEARVERFQTTVRDMFRTVEDDPRDLSAARRYLGVYLQGARDATAKFADLYGRTRDTGARADYETLLDDLETGFSAKTRALLLDNKSDMTVEIEVLRERLEREGVAINE